MNDSTNRKKKARKKPRFKLPGKLKGSAARLTVRSPDGWSLVQGRSQSPNQTAIAGLATFSGRAGHIYHNAADGNPFADYQLVQIEDCIRQTGEFLDQQAGDLAAIAAQVDADLAVTPPTQSPSTITMHLGRYGTTAARLVLQGDKLAVASATLRYHQMIDIKTDRNIRERIRTRLRRLLAQGGDYKASNCTRLDLRDHNEVARNTIDKLIASHFLDPAMFSSIEEICDVYAAYDTAPEFGPIVDRTVGQSPGNRAEAGTDPGNTIEHGADQKASQGANAANPGDGAENGAVKTAWNVTCLKGPLGPLKVRGEAVTIYDEFA